jgi:hypothetical protein
VRDDLRRPTGAARRPGMASSRPLARLMLIGFSSAHNQPATKEFLVMQFLHRTLCFFDGLHLDESKTFRALIVAITYDLGILDVTNAVE